MSRGGLNAMSESAAMKDKILTLLDLLPSTAHYPQHYPHCDFGRVWTMWNGESKVSTPWRHPELLQKKPAA